MSYENGTAIKINYLFMNSLLTKMRKMILNGTAAPSYLVNIMRYNVDVNRIIFS
jgi:hypothetical protein